MATTSAAPNPTNATAAKPADLTASGQVTQSGMDTNPAIQATIQENLNFGGIKPTVDQANQAIQARIKDMQAAASIGVSSDATRNGISQLGGDIKKEAGKPTAPVVPGTGTELPSVTGVALTSDAEKQQQADLDKLYTDRANLLAQRRKQEVDRLNQEAELQKQALGKAQVREVGSTTANLARIGGFLGGSASEMGVLTNLEITHRGEMQSLEAKRQQAIQAANNAYDDMDFQLSREKLAEAKDLRNEMYKRENDFRNYQLDVYSKQRSAYEFDIQEQRAQRTQELAEKKEARAASEFIQTQAWEAAKEAMKNDIEMGKFFMNRILDFKNVSQYEAEMIASALGISVDAVRSLSPDATKQLAKEAAADKKILDTFKSQLSILNTLSAIPQNKVVPITGLDGKTTMMRGLKKASSGTGNGTKAPVGTWSQAPVLDKDGKQIGIVTFNNKTQERVFSNITGTQSIVPPSGATIGTWSQAGDRPESDIDAAVADAKAMIDEADSGPVIVE